MSEQIEQLTPNLRLEPPSFAAAVLKTTEGTLAVWRSTKRYELPYVKIGGKVFYRVSDLEKFIESRTMSGVSEGFERQGRGRKASA
jgi:hypothetical protein